MKSCHWLKINSYNIFPHFFKDPFPGKKKRKSFGGSNEDDALVEGLFFFSLASALLLWRRINYLKFI